MLRECLSIREKASGKNDWRIAEARRVLAECLTKLAKFTEAEPLLLDGYEGLTTAGETIPAQVRDQRLREAIQRVVDLYEAWHAAEPGQGYDAKADQWRARLPAKEEE